MERIKQVIVMRKDLNMRKGKMVVQGAHASLAVLLDMMNKSNYSLCKHRRWSLDMSYGSPLEAWLTDRFVKIVVGCNSEEELLELYDKAKTSGLHCALITDAGFTEFHGEPTNTCIAIGPDWSEKIDKITGHLKLL